ncbi:S8 family serine peptidase [Sporosarcina sp. Sa2YVA2]|uniref:S8 family serine peptidase n=1 Tax=Sporosarcina quadrami TaxID=2762234 RepID=A0ABR8U7I6_9BACL|nr:S8 family serine peptidase [Sporosarcina quadrami]MBD7983994.1 S8 family serine peptidase [Sporosarcina quadrami]
MQNSTKKTQTNEEIDIIIHLAEEPVAVQKRMAQMNGIPFTEIDEENIEAAINAQQQSVLEEMAAQHIYFKKPHLYKTVLNAISTVIRKKDLDKLSSIRDVMLVEPNAAMEAMSLPSADYRAPQVNEFDPVHAEVQALWAEGIQGQGVKVAVLDSGIDPDHPDIRHAYRGGINFVDQSDTEKYSRLRAGNDPSETSPDERSNVAPEKGVTSGRPFETHHGTHIAGIIAGKNENGVKGVAPGVDLYAYRIFGGYMGGSLTTILEAIEKAVVEKMDILNLSLSDNSDLENHALSIAVNNAILAGVVVVSTAGNTGSVRGSIRTPGTSRMGIAVGNSTIDDELDSSSSRGPSRPNFDIKPDIVAPGTEIYSTMPGYGVKAAYKNAYARETGTSQAAPYITGVAALMKQAHPEWSPLDIKVAMTNTAKVLDTTSYNVFDQGSGRIRPYAAVHPSIVAYCTEEIDADGKGHIVENRRGAITFGSVKLAEDVTITKLVLVKDIKGDGGVYDVNIQITEPFEGATITVDQPSFTLDGECLLDITLTAPKSENTKYRDEILGYVHITSADRSVEVSLPFAADFSDGATVIPAIEEFSITKKDISFGIEEANDETEVTLSINSDLSYPSLEITDYLSKAPLDSLFYSNGMSLGTWKYPILHRFTSSWTNEDTTLEDGIYSIDFTGMANGEPLTDTIGPIFVKSTKPVITGSVNGSTVSGQVTDQYIDFSTTLTELGEGFDVNEKLAASYSVTSDGNLVTTDSFILNQDGTFSVELDSLHPEHDRITITITDAAGNNGELSL